MDSYLNAISIIKDKDFDTYDDVITKHTKNGYKVKYKREKEFLPVDNDYNGEYIFLGIMVIIVSIGFSLAILSCLPMLWFVIPLITLGFTVYIGINSSKWYRQDIILTFISFITTLLVTWCVFAGAYNGNFYNDTKVGKRNFEYVKENINPKILFFK